MKQVNLRYRLSLAVGSLVQWARVGEDYCGPARVEVFGHHEHIGMVRASAARIDILSVQGEAIQLSPEARFRLTPLLWQALSDYATLHRATIDAGIKDLRERRKEEAGAYERRLQALREAIRVAGEALLRIAPTATADILVDMRAALSNDDHDDAIPF